MAAPRRLLAALLLLLLLLGLVLAAPEAGMFEAALTAPGTAGSRKRTHAGHGSGPGCQPAPRGCGDRSWDQSIPARHPGELDQSIPARGSRAPGGTGPRLGAPGMMGMQGPAQGPLRKAPDGKDAQGGLTRRLVRPRGARRGTAQRPGGWRRYRRPRPRLSHKGPMPF